MLKKLPLIVLFSLASLCNFSIAVAITDTKPLQVVVSSKPFHSLVAGVMAGTGSPTLLIRGSHSPHNYALKPRDAQQLQDADLIFWGGHHIEPFLEKPLQSLAANTPVLSFDTVQKITQLPVREGVIWGEESQHDDHAHHTHESMDPHIWLDPLNAKELVESIAATLSQINPQAEKQYRENGDRLQQRLEVLHQELQQQMQPLAGRAFMVYHDSYQYFEKRYHLQTVGAVTQHVEHGSSAGALQQVRRQIAAHQIRCIFKEPQFSSRLVQVAAEGSHARISVLDPIGANLIPGADLYFQLLRNISRSLRSCL